MDTKRTGIAHGTALARMQRKLVLAAAVAGLVVLWWAIRADSPWAWGLLALAVTGHAWVMAFEMLVAAYVNRGDPSPERTLFDACHAWWRESITAPRVFGWRQPFRSHRWPDTAALMSPGESKVPAVVLIHGFVCNRGFWGPWMQEMRARGIPYVSVNLEPVFGSIDDYAPLIDAAVAAAHHASHTAPVVICHSMGGLAARAWMAADPGHRSRVSRVITIGSPHHGTWLAHHSRVRNGRQMQPGGAWLKDLATRETVAAGEGAYQPFLCWYTHTDNIVFPASTATLPGADNRHVPGCGHVDLAFHPRVITESLAVVASAASSPSERTVS